MVFSYFSFKWQSGSKLMAKSLLLSFTNTVVPQYLVLVLSEGCPNAYCLSTQQIFPFKE